MGSSTAYDRLVSAVMKILVNFGDLKGKTIIDLGCGYGLWGHLIRTQVDTRGNYAYIVGCDIYRPYVEETKRHNPYDDLVICDIRNLPFRQNIIDIIIACEIIEHLSKKDGNKLLREISLLCRTLSVVSTPQGYFQQGAFRGNVFEKHISVWSKSDLEKYEYKISKRGYGIDLESFVRRYHIFYFVQKLLLRSYHKLRSDWAGVMLVGYKKHG